MSNDRLKKLETLAKESPFEGERAAANEALKRLDNPFNSILRKDHQRELSLFAYALNIIGLDEIDIPNDFIWVTKEEKLVNLSSVERQYLERIFHHCRKTLEREIGILKVDGFSDVDYDELRDWYEEDQVFFWCASHSSVTRNHHFRTCQNYVMSYSELKRRNEK